MGAWGLSATSVLGRGVFVFVNGVGRGVFVFVNGVDVRDRIDVEEGGGGDDGDDDEVGVKDRADNVLPQTLPLTVGGVMDLDRFFVFSEVGAIEGWIEGKKYSEKVGVVGLCFSTFVEIEIAKSLMAGEDVLDFICAGIDSMSLMMAAGKDALDFMCTGRMVLDSDFVEIILAMSLMAGEDVLDFKDTGRIFLDFDDD